MRRHQLRIILCTFALGSAAVGACRSTSDETPPPSSEAAPNPPPADDVRREALSLPLAPRVGPESRQPERRQRDPLDRLLPPEHPPQRLALSRYRLAELDGEQLIVRRLGDLAIATSFAVPDGRNVIPLVG